MTPTTPTTPAVTPSLSALAAKTAPPPGQLVPAGGALAGLGIFVPDEPASRYRRREYALAGLAAVLARRGAYSPSPRAPPRAPPARAPSPSAAMARVQAQVAAFNEQILAGEARLREAINNGVITRDEYDALYRLFFDYIAQNASALRDGTKPFPAFGRIFAPYQKRRAAALDYYQTTGRVTPPPTLPSVPPPAEAFRLGLGAFAGLNDFDDAPAFWTPGFVIAGLALVVIAASAAYDAGLFDVEYRRRPQRRRRGRRRA